MSERTSAPRPRISVCMATYNGERFLRAQVESILTQLGPRDELVVVDDCSTDGTVAMLRAFGDERIRIHPNSRNSGHPASFGRAIAIAVGEVILLADQDDTWVPGRVDALAGALRDPATALVSSNSAYVDTVGDPIAFPVPPLRGGDSARRAVNIARIFRGTASYFGCAMAFRASFRRLVLPIPRYVEAHDLWIAMAANLAGVNRHLEEITLRRRIHGGNASVISRPLRKKLWARAKFSLAMLHLSLRLITTSANKGKST